MSNSYYTHPADIAPYTRALSQSVNDRMDLIDSGFAKLPTEDEFKRGLVSYGVDSGVADAYVVALPYPTVALVDGLEVTWKVTAENTGASTVNLDGLGVKSLVQADMAALAAADLVVGTIVTMKYTTSIGGFFVILSTTPGYISRINAAESAAGVSAAAALVSENNAAASESNASDSETKANEWAEAAYSVEVETGQYSALHWSAMANKWAEAAYSVEVETGQYSALHWSAMANKWANDPEDTVVSGGEYSAYHYAMKAQQAAGSVDMPVIQTGDAGKVLTVNEAEDGWEVALAAINVALSSDEQVTAFTGLVSKDILTSIAGSPPLYSTDAVTWEMLQPIGQTIINVTGSFYLRGWYEVGALDLSNIGDQFDSGGYGATYLNSDLYLCVTSLTYRYSGTTGTLEQSTASGGYGVTKAGDDLIISSAYTAIVFADGDLTNTPTTFDLPTFKAPVCSDGTNLLLLGQYVSSDLNSVVFSADGTRCFTTYGAYIAQSDLSVAYDISTAVFSGQIQSNLIITANSAAYDIAFSADGLSMYILDNSDALVYQYALSIAWDILTATDDNKTLDYSGETTDAYSFLSLSSDGSKVYVGARTAGRIYQYTLTTPWNLSTGSYASKQAILTDSPGAISMAIGDSGSALYVSSTTAVYQYTLLTPWDMATADYTGKTFTQSSQSFDINPDGSELYLFYDLDSIFTYSLSTAWDLDTETLDNTVTDFNTTSIITMSGYTATISSIIKIGLDISSNPERWDVEYNNGHLVVQDGFNGILYVVQISSGDILQTLSFRNLYNRDTLAFRGVFYNTDDNIYSIIGYNVMANDLDYNHLYNLDQPLSVSVSEAGN